jgi:hypothetical protein
MDMGVAKPISGIAAVTFISEPARQFASFANASAEDA